MQEETSWVNFEIPKKQARQAQGSSSQQRAEHTLHLVPFPVTKMIQ
jgi:hypothetical protein